MTVFRLSVLGLIATLSLVTAETETQWFSAVSTGGKKNLTVVQGKLSDGVAWGHFSNDVNATGWGRLYVETNPAQEPKLQMYAAGFIEGVLTQKMIYYAKINHFEDSFTNNEPPKDLLRWLRENTRFMRQHISENPTSVYWNQVHLILKQLHGLHAGYESVAPAGEELTLMDLLVHQVAQGDWYDLQPALQYQEKHPVDIAHASPRDTFRYFTNHSHCSALVKIVEKHGKPHDIFIGHATWGDYQTMLRIFKTYVLPLDGEQSAPVSVQFSSYPGLLGSNDDFYMMKSSQMVVTETTLTSFAMDIYKNVTTSSVLYWIRVILANRMATDGTSWLHYFSQFNSGTYNNQMIVLDMKKFTVGKQVQDGLLLIAEQLPSQIVARDMTHHIRESLFWPSFNVPYFHSVYEAMGFPAEAKKDSLYTYYETARYLIFKKQQHTVDSVHTMEDMMTYNHWQTDKESRGHPSDSIAARFDLEAPAKYNDDHHLRDATGAIDAKFTSFSLAQNSHIRAISGPSHKSQPPFSWDNTEWSALSHLGHPRVFSFDWQTMNAEQDHPIAV